MDRLERWFASIPPDPAAVRAAFAEFREYGELPESVPVAHAVIRWAETGVDETRFPGDDRLSREARLRAYLNAPHCEDQLMNALRAEAVFADMPVRGIARIILQQFAADGHDPTQPLFEQGKIPKPDMTWGWVALSMVRFPFGIVDKAHHEVLAEILGRFDNIRKQLDGLSDVAKDDWLDRLGRAVDEFQETGSVPEDALQRDAVFAHRDLIAVLRAARDRGNHLPADCPTVPEKP